MGVRVGVGVAVGSGVLVGVGSNVGGTSVGVVGRSVGCVRSSVGISVSTLATWVATISGVGWVWSGILQALNSSVINIVMIINFFMLASFLIGIGYLD